MGVASLRTAPHPTVTCGLLRDVCGCLKVDLFQNLKALGLSTLSKENPLTSTERDITRLCTLKAAHCNHSNHFPNIVSSDFNKYHLEACTAPSFNPLLPRVQMSWSVIFRWVSLSSRNCNKCVQPQTVSPLSPAPFSLGSQLLSTDRQ